MEEHSGTTTCPRCRSNLFETTCKTNVENFVFTIHYQGRCEGCGFEFVFGDEVDMIRKVLRKVGK